MTTPHGNAMSPLARRMRCPILVGALLVAPVAFVRADDIPGPPPPPPPVEGSPAPVEAPPEAPPNAKPPAAKDPKAATTPKATAPKAKAPAERVVSGDDRTDWRTGDQLEIKVLSRPELSCGVTVLDDGSIDVPFAGRFEIAKRTIEQVRKEVAEALAKIEKDPMVAITVTSLSPDEFYVLGEAVKAGVYVVPRTKRISFLQALGMAGGFTPEADFVRVQIIPAGGGAPKTIDASPARMSALSSVFLSNGDSVVVPAIGRIYMMGQVNRTGGFVPPAGERMTLTRAIALAGGFSRLADTTSVLVTWRDPAGNAQTIRYNVKAILNGASEDVTVYPGNLVFVPERLL